MTFEEDFIHRAYIAKRERELNEFQRSVSLPRRKPMAAHPRKEISVRMALAWTIAMFAFCAEVSKRLH